ncbi:MAG TPA: dTMP kinase [Thermodesulfovibrionia bacterium]|nr:dTMP kinase [Thermodesulfovibrionia bacterium]
MKGFISFEGIDGVGKTTQIRMLADYLKNLGKNVMVCHEPGGTRIGEIIRKILLAPDFTEMTGNTELLLYYASRSQLLSEVILPALNDNKIVLADRFIDSTFAYQGYGQGIKSDLIDAIDVMVTEQIRPELTLLLDLDVQEAVKRSKKQDRYEQAAIDFTERVRNGFLDLAAKSPQRIRVIDSSGTHEETHQHILAVIEETWLLKTS